MYSSTKTYDVFLSFRGDDTRRDFTKHLFDALKKKLLETYMDTLIDRGEDVWAELEKAIDNSQLSIVVFSENYANSKWCLEELHRILQRRRSNNQVVIPVFYEIDPSDIRKLTGTYGKAFAKYEAELGDKDERINQWKADLIEASNISGWDSRTHRDDAELIENVVNDVSQKQNLRRPIELKGLVGIEKIYSKFKVYMDQVRVLGIWGTAGMGKTIIAKVLFAELFPKFDNVCFIDCAKENSLDKVLSELIKQGVTGMTFDMSRLQSKKVLIVLDGVRSSDKLLLDHLLSGYRFQNKDSRLIITTRDKQLIEKRVDAIERVEPWENDESRRLFISEAFGETGPPEGFEDLIKRAVKYAGGMPLALQVLGSCLHSKDTTFWESTLRKLEKHPNERIQNVLKVSYDELDDQQKKIFLDIAFFFNGEEKDHVKSILDACGFEASSEIEVLHDKALITISPSNVIEMHSLLREMAFQIERQESSKNRRRRVRDSEEFNAVLKENKGTDVVEGIILDLSQINDLCLSADTFKKMNNLRFLKLYIHLGQSSRNVHLPRALESFSDKLRYLEWNGYPLESLPQAFCAKLLVEIRMPHSQVKQLWQGIQELDNLERIDLSDSKQLILLPDLSKASRLKWVNLSGCEGLRTLHKSVLSSDTLVTLVLDGCTNLSSVKGDRHLKSLQNITVNGCSSLKEFAVSSDLIESLDLSKTSIEKLDSSIGFLRNLRLLNLVGILLEHLPEELSNLKSLTELKISSTRLKIEKHKLQVLFDGLLQSLQILHLKECSFELPDNIGALSKLQNLRLDGSSVKSLPTSIKHLSELEILSLKNCTALESLPELPPFIMKFYAQNCTSLKFVSNLKTFATKMVGKMKRISFKNSLKLDVPSLNSIMQGLYSTMLKAAMDNKSLRYNAGGGYNYNSVEACVPGSRVPMECTHQTNKSSITIQLPMSSNLLGFIYYVVLSPSQGIKAHGAKIQCQCDLARGTKATWQDKYIGELNSDHVYIWYDPFHCDIILKFNEPKLSFEFSVTNDEGEVDASIIIKGCGVQPMSISDSPNHLLELDSDKKKLLGKEFELDSQCNKTTSSQQLHAHASQDYSQVQIPPLQPPTAMKKGSPNEKKSEAMRNQFLNQQRNLSEQTSHDRKIEESKSVKFENDARSSNNFTGVEKSMESASNENMTSAGRGRRENNKVPTKDVKIKGNEGKPTEFEAGLLLPIGSIGKKNVSHSMSHYNRPNNTEESQQPEESQNLQRQKPIVHRDIHDLTAEEPYLEKENEQMKLDLSKVQDEDPYRFLLLSQKSSPEAACRTSNVVREALHNLEFLLGKSLENIIGDELQGQLQASLESIEQASKENVSSSVAGFVKNMASSVVDLLKGFALAKEEVEDHTSFLKQKDILVQQAKDAMKQRESLQEEKKKCKVEDEALDKEAEDLDERIRILVEQKKQVQKKQKELKVALEEYDGEEKKQIDKDKNLADKIIKLNSAIENSKVSYAAAIFKQGELKRTWEGFGKSFAENEFSKY